MFAVKKERKDWLLRLPADLHARVEAVAKRDRRSLNGTYAMLIERGLKGGSGYTIWMKFDTESLGTMKAMTKALMGRGSAAKAL